MKRIVVVAALAALGAALGACGEREQAALYEDGKYRGKPDTRPWDNAPPAYGRAGWDKGDRASWENQMRSRNVASQNEYGRIGH